MHWKTPQVALSINSFKKREYKGLLQKKDTVFTNAVPTTRSSEHKACCFMEEWWDGYAVGLTKRQKLCNDCHGRIQKSCRIIRPIHKYSPAYATYF